MIFVLRERYLHTVDRMSNPAGKMDHMSMENRWNRPANLSWDHGEAQLGILYDVRLLQQNSSRDSADYLRLCTLCHVADAAAYC